jgi:hypothetical protein
VRLLHADSSGVDRYMATFEKGNLEYGITPPGPDGKIDRAFIRPSM